MQVFYVDYTYNYLCNHRLTVIWSVWSQRTKSAKTTRTISGRAFDKWIKPIESGWSQSVCVCLAVEAQIGLFARFSLAH